MKPGDFKYTIDQSTLADVRNHLKEVNESFYPPLDSYVDIPEYSKKIIERARRFEVWADQKLIGLIAGYLNEQKYFITNVSINTKYSEFKIAHLLLLNCINEVRKIGVHIIELEVFNENERAVGFYKKNGFLLKHSDKYKSIYMLTLN